MKVLILLCVSVSMAMAPFAPSAAAAVIPVAVADSCAMACCHGGKTEPAQRSTSACHCPSACVIPAQTTAVLPGLAGVCPPAPNSRGHARVCDEHAIVRTVRPPVPPPRA